MRVPPPEEDVRVGRFVLGALPSRGDVLLIVPPLCALHAPPVAPSLLQAIGRRAGFRVELLYANLAFADAVGLRTYRALVKAASRSLLGERLFCSAAYGLPFLGQGADRLRSRFEGFIAEHELSLEWSDYERSARRGLGWAEAVADAIARLDFAVVGCTTMFEQTSASLALLERIKRQRPEILTILGGANCEGEMAQAISALSPAVDYVFSGESDRTFPLFLEQVRDGRRPNERIIAGSLLHELDPLPTPSFADYFEQTARLFPPSAETRRLWDQLRVPLESSRGCWWGQKHHCTFCGLNGLGMAFREKSADRAVEQLQQVMQEYPFELVGSDKLSVSMTDNIMPHTYFRTLVPRLHDEVPRADIFYEQKANLSLQDLLALRRAGIAAIQAGIETLSTSFAKRMRKGVSASQNITVLRYAVSAQLVLCWNLLYDFPGDEENELREMLELLPLLHHLPPPDVACPLGVDRFSPYFERPADHGLRNVRPLDSYAEVFPSHVPPAQVAYFFHADYESASRRHPELIEALKSEVRRWRDAWSKPGAVPPQLRVERTSGAYRDTTGSTYILLDTRRIAGGGGVRPLDEQEAMLLTVRRRLDGSPEIERALAERLGVARDGLFVPLATAHPSLLLEHEARAQPSSWAVNRSTTVSAQQLPASGRSPTW